MLLASLEDVKHLGARLQPEHAGPAPYRVTWQELEGPGALRYLVRAEDGRALATAVLQGASRRLGRPFGNLRELGAQAVLDAFRRDFKPRTAEVMEQKPSDITAALDTDQDGAVRQHRPRGAVAAAVLLRVEQRLQSAVRGDPAGHGRAGDVVEPARPLGEVGLVGERLGQDDVQQRLEHDEVGPGDGLQVDALPVVGEVGRG